MENLLLKKSYLLKDLKQVPFKDLWNSYGIFTTMRLIGKPPKILFYNQHIKNFIRSLEIYEIKSKNLSEKINKIIRINIFKEIKYDHLLRIAANKKFISISLRQRKEPNKNLTLKLLNYKRIDPKLKNLKYKKILNILKKNDTSKFDIALYKDKNFLETGTSNLIFVKNNKVFSPKNGYYKGTTYSFFKKKIKIISSNVSINELKKFDEIILLGSGKGVASVNKIENKSWKRNSTKIYKKLSHLYDKEIKRIVSSK